MENNEKQNKNLSWTIVIVVALILVVIFRTTISNTESTNKSDDSPTVINKITNFFTPESDAQIKCQSSTQKAFDNWSGKLSKQFYTSLVLGLQTDEILNTDSSANYRYNYNTATNLCFLEYIFSWKIDKVSTGNEAQFVVKVVQALFFDTRDPTTSNSQNPPLASLLTATTQSGSQTVQHCSVMAPGHYDDPTQKPIGELFNPTKCTSESEFNSLVMERFGIK